MDVWNPNNEGYPFGQYEGKHRGSVDADADAPDMGAYVPRHTSDAARYTNALDEAIRALREEYAS